MTTIQRDMEGRMRPICRIRVDKKIAESVAEILGPHRLGMLIDELVLQHIGQIRKQRKMEPFARKDVYMQSQLNDFP